MPVSAATFNVSATVLCMGIASSSVSIRVSYCLLMCALQTSSIVLGRFPCYCVICTYRTCTYVSAWKACFTSTTQPVRSNLSLTVSSATINPHITPHFLPCTNSTVECSVLLEVLVYVRIYTHLRTYMHTSTYMHTYEAPDHDHST